MVEIKAKVKSHFVKRDKYNIYSASIYKVFEAYPKSVVDIVLIFYKRQESNSLSLLRRMYGYNFDGVGAKRDLSYMEKDTLSGLCMRMEEFLEFVLKQVKKGEKLEKLEKIFLKKSDVEILNMMKSESITNVSTNEFDLVTFLRENNLTMDKLSNIIDYHDNSTERIIFKRKHGINCPKMTNKAICNSLLVDASTLAVSLKNVENNLPNLIKVAQAAEDNLKELNYQTGTKKEKKEKIEKPKVVVPKVVTPKKESTTPKKVTSVPKKDDKPKSSERSEKPKRVRTNHKVGTIIGNRSTEKKFVYFFATYGMSEEKIKNLENKVIEIAFVLKEKWSGAFKLLTKYFGEDLKSTYNGQIDPEDLGRYRGFIDKIRSLQNLEIDEIKKQLTEQPKPIKVKKVKVKKVKEQDPNKIIGNRGKTKKFVNFFATYGMDEEEVKKLEDKVIEIAFILKDKWPSAFPLLTKYFGEDLRKTYEGTIDSADAPRYNQFVKRITALKDVPIDEIKKEAAKTPKRKKEHSPDKPIGNRGQKKKFVNFFATYGMDEEEVKKLEDKAIELSLLLGKSWVTSFATLTKIFGEDLRKTYEGTISIEDINSYKQFVKKIRKLLKKDFEEAKKELMDLKEGKRTSRKKDQDIGVIGNSGKEKRFVYFFAKVDMSEEEIKRLEDKVIEIALLLKNRYKKGFEVFTKYFGEDLKNVYEGEIELDDFGRYRTLKEKIRSLQDLEMDEIKKQLIKPPKPKKEKKKKIKVYPPDKIIGNRGQEKRFVYYFATHGMDEEEVKKLENKVIEIAFLLKDSKQSSFKAAQEFFGEDLRKTFEGNIVKENGNSLKYLIKKIAEYKDMEIPDIKVAIENSGRRSSSGCKQKKEKVYDPNKIIGNKGIDKKLVNFFATHGMDEEEVKKLEDKVVSYVSDYKHSDSQYYKVMTKYFGETLRETFTGSFEEADRALIQDCIKTIRYNLTPDDKIIGNRGPKKRFVYFFATRKMSEEEINKLENKVIEIAFLLKGTWPVSFEIMTSIFGESLRDSYYDSITVGSSNAYKSFIKKIKEYQDLEMDEIKKLINFQEKESTNRKAKLEYIDFVINYKIIEENKTPEQASIELDIPLEVVITSIINNIKHYNRGEVMKYVIYSHPEYLEVLLESNYFKPLVKNLADDEKRLIYLKLLSVTNEDITPESIANELSITVEEVVNYQISLHSENKDVVILYLK